MERLPSRLCELLKILFLRGCRNGELQDTWRISRHDAGLAKVKSDSTPPPARLFTQETSAPSAESGIEAGFAERAGCGHAHADLFYPASRRGLERRARRSRKKRSRCFHNPSSETWRRPSGTPLSRMEADLPVTSSALIKQSSKTRGARDRLPAGFIGHD